MQKIFKPKKTAKSSIQSLCHTVHRSLPVPCFRAPLRRHVLPPYCAPCCAGMFCRPTARPVAPACCASLLRALFCCPAAHPVLLPRCADLLRRLGTARIEKSESVLYFSAARYSTNQKIKRCAVFLGGQVQHESQNLKFVL